MLFGSCLLFLLYTCSDLFAWWWLGYLLCAPLPLVLRTPFDDTSVDSGFSFFKYFLLSKFAVAPGWRAPWMGGILGSKDCALSFPVSALLPL